MPLTNNPERDALYLLATGRVLWWHEDFPKRGPGGRIMWLATVDVDMEVSGALVRLFCRQRWVEETIVSGHYHCAVLTQAGAASLRHRARGLSVYGHREHQEEHVTYAAFLFAAVERWEDRGKILTFPGSVAVSNQA